MNRTYVKTNTTGNAEILGPTPFREGQWKLFVADEKTELCDIWNDPGEALTLSDEYPDAITRLKSRSREYWKEIDAAELLRQNR